MRNYAILSQIRDREGTSEGGGVRGGEDGERVAYAVEDKSQRENERQRGGGERTAISFTSPSSISCFRTSEAPWA